MAAATLCLVLIALACLAFVAGRLVKLPLPFLQIAVGAIAALPPFDVQLTLDPELFLFLFIPPLLFADGWNIPQRELRAMRWPVLGHAVGLVLLTVLAGGYFLHWLIPSLPLSVAFAVAAVVSPTDSVALSSITEHIRVPHRMMHLLESEALLNDATGLFAMRAAVTVTLSGGLSLLHAAATLLLAGAGLLIGFAVALLYRVVHRRLLIRAQDATVQTLLTGLLPFAAYAAALAVGASGILAAVGAGMAASRTSLLEAAHYSARLQTGVTWSVVGFCLNGTIFVLLGLQLPGIIGAGPAGIDLLTSPGRLAILGEIGALAGLLVLIRLLWVLASIGVGRLRVGREHVDDWRVVLASSVAGVRGAVTLAGVLGLPLLLPDGAPFPGRDLAITLATGTILSSMIIAAIGLPLLLRHSQAEHPAEEQERQLVRIIAAEAVLHSLSASEHVAGGREARLQQLYTSRLASLRSKASQDERRDDDEWRRLHQLCLHVERAAIQRLRLNGHVGDVQARQVLAELDLLEAALTQRPMRLGQPIDGAETEPSASVPT